MRIRSLVLMVILITGFTGVCSAHDTCGRIFTVERSAGEQRIVIHTRFCGYALAKILESDPKAPLGEWHFIMANNGYLTRTDKSKVRVIDYGTNSRKNVIQILDSYLTLDEALQKIEDNWQPDEARK